MTIQVDEQKCNGCTLCQTACALGQTNAGKHRKVRDLPLPLLKISGAQGRRSINICRHCERPLCVDACVAKALTIDTELGIVSLDRAKCVGCRSCVMECPFGAVFFPEVLSDSLPKQNGHALKCEGCQEWDKPLCASLCPTGALQASRAGNGVAAGNRRRRSALMNMQLTGDSRRQGGGFGG